jgi:hypothetical protein
VDNGNARGLPDPNRVSKLNNGTATQNINTAATTIPACSARAIDSANNPVSADPADRTSHNVVGAPRCDT